MTMINEPVLDKVYKPMHTVTTSARVQMAVKENDIVRHALENFGNELASIDRNAQRAIDVRQIENLMSAHFYYFWANKREEELDLFWSKQKDDIAYGLENKAYIGREALYGYYVTEYGKMQVEKLEKLSVILGVENTPENLGVGDMALDLSTSPFIEVAGDGMTAQAIIITMSYRVEIDEAGKPEYNHIRSRFGFDFVKEQDETTGGAHTASEAHTASGARWKIWHIRQLADICLPCGYKDPNSRKAFDDTSLYPKGNTAAPESTMYDPSKAPKLEPALPLPYETWDEKQAVMEAPLLKKISISVEDLGRELGAPQGEPQLPPGASLPPGMPVMKQTDWSVKPYLELAAKKVGELTEEADEAELVGGGASWIFSALAGGMKTCTPRIFIPPMNKYVPVRPLKMGAPTRDDVGVTFTAREDGDRAYIEVQETFSSKDQGELAKKAAKARIPEVAAGMHVCISGMMPNFIAVGVALGYAAAGAKSVSIRLSSEKEYTCCISNCSEICVGDKLI